MSITFRALILSVLLLCSTQVARAEVLVRWDLDQVPARDSLGISAILIPGTKPAAVADALGKGYRVHLEMEDGALPAALPLDKVSGLVVRGPLSAEQLRHLRRRLGSPAARVVPVENRGKWPHVRLNWVTRRNGVLQVSSRTAQPWLENNGALVRIAQLARPESAPLLSYPWQPITVSDVHQGPSLENYLVAVAEAGSFGSDLILPLHESFQRRLLLGTPDARKSWQEIRRYLEFYSWDLPRQYQPIANIGVITAEPMRDFEIMNLLTRHNLPFELIAPERVAARGTAGLDMLIVLEQPAAKEVDVLSEFVRGGGRVVLVGVAGDFPWHAAAPVQEIEGQAGYAFGEGHVLELRDQVADPNAFAMQMRDVLGRDRRVLDIWNGITVLTAPYKDPSGDTVLLSVVNYAHEPQPVQLRVRGTFSIVQYETPGEDAVLLPFQHREGYTEFVVPSLRIGGRVFLSRDVRAERTDACD